LFNVQREFKWVRRLHQHTLIWTITPYQGSYIFLPFNCIAPDSLRAVSLILPCSASCFSLVDQRLWPIVRRLLHSGRGIVSGGLVWLHPAMHQRVIYHQDWYVHFWHGTGPDIENNYSSHYLHAKINRGRTNIGGSGLYSSTLAVHVHDELATVLSYRRPLWGRLRCWISPATEEETCTALAARSAPATSSGECSGYQHVFPMAHLYGMGPRLRYV